MDANNIHVRGERDSDNSQEHVINDCTKTEKLRTKLIKELNDLDNATKIKHF